MQLSRDPQSGVEYALPETPDDGAALDAFLTANGGKPIVVVQGLGFVGAVMSLVCANALGADYAVIGVDLATPASYWRIAALREGRFPVVADDPLITQLHRDSVARGNFLATHDARAYAHADVVIVDVNLDVKKSNDDRGELKSFDVDLAPFRSAIASIGRHCRADVLVLVETTVPPGTCQAVVKPVLERELRLRGLPLDAYQLGHSYERVMPGPDYVESIRSFPRVYAGIDERSADAVQRFLETIIDTSRCELRRLASTTASEMAKVLENAYRAMNIAFVVEWSRFAEEAGVDLYEVVHAVRMRKTHANLMFPGIGVGGYCLTKDSLLASWARQHLFDATQPLGQSVATVSINDQMPRHAAERLRRVYGPLDGLRIAVLGVAYRGDVGDTRFSPVELFVRCLETAGASVACHDPYVTQWPELDRPVTQDLAAVLDDSPAIVALCAMHREYGAERTIEALLRQPPLFIYDTLGLLSAQQIARLQTRHRVSVLGRGDLGSPA